MANTFSTQTLIDKAVAFAFNETAGISTKIDWRSDEFSPVNNTGSAISLRRPSQFLATKNSLGLDSDPTSIVPTAGYRSHQEPTVQLAVDARFDINIGYSLEDLTMKMSKDQAYDRAIRPAMVSLQDNINAYLISKLGLAGGQVLSGATPGSTTGAEWVTNFHKVNELYAARGLAGTSDKKTIILQPGAVPSVATYGATLFQNPTAGATMKEGQIGSYAGFDIFQSSLLGTNTTPVALSATATVTSVSISEATTAAPVWAPTFKVTVNTLSNDLAAGTIVSFAGVNWVHPSTKVDTGKLATFKVQSAVSAGSSKEITLSEIGIYAGDYQNISAPITGKVMSVAYAGVARPSYAFLNGAVAGASPKIIIPAGVKGRNIDLGGINVALVEDHIPGTLNSITKLVAFVGLSVVRPEAIVTLY